MLARLRAGLVRAPSAGIMEDVARSITTFETEIRAAGLSADQAEVAKYALCATADDIIQNIPVDDRRLWTQYSMLSQFFGERIGGVRFFDELNRMKADPLKNIDVLEFMHSCLALGFEGIHRTAQGGVATLQQIQRDLYDTVRRVRPQESAELSPRWRGQEIALASRRNRVPAWAAAAMALALVSVVFLGLRTILVNDATAVADELLALHPLTPVTLVRPEFRLPPPPPPPPEPEPVVVAEPAPPLPPPPPSAVDVLRERLAAEIGNGRVVLDETGGDIRITVGDIPGLVLFPSGKTDVSAAYLPTIELIGSLLRDMPGPITVIGHTDSVPIRSVRFPSNYELSVARANAVGEVLKAKLADPSRVEAKGRGADQPLVPNDTAEGRARNRRVDIIVPRAG
jgi:type VI secretion system protein ImpK